MSSWQIITLDDGRHWVTDGNDGMAADSIPEVLSALALALACIENCCAARPGCGMAVANDKSVIRAALEKAGK